MISRPCKRSHILYDNDQPFKQLKDTEAIPRRPLPAPACTAAWGQGRSVTPNPSGHSQVAPACSRAWGERGMGVTASPQIQPAVPRRPLPALGVGMGGHGGHSVTPNPSSHSQETTACPTFTRAWARGGKGGRSVTPNLSSPHGWAWMLERVCERSSSCKRTCAHTQVSLHSHPASRAPQKPTWHRQSL